MFRVKYLLLYKLVFAIFKQAGKYYLFQKVKSEKEVNFVSDS